MGERRKGRTTLGLLLALAVAGVAIVALGGLRPAGSRARRLTPRESIDAGQWRVRPLRAWASGRCPLASASAPPAPCLNVELELTNLTRTSRSDVTSALRLVEPRLATTLPPELALVRDAGGRLGYLHPRLPERVIMSWKLPGAAPGAVTLGIDALRFKERDNLTGGEGWFDPRRVAEARLPVAVEPAPDAAPEAGR